MDTLLQLLRDRASPFIATVKDRLQSRSWASRPETINIEITAVCDAKCIHCPREAMDRPVRPMAFELFQKLVDEAAEMRVPQLCPNGFGEILTVKNLEQYLAYVSSRSHPFKVIINTNGNRMTDDKIEMFIRHRIALLNICIDGATKETAEAVRVHLDFDRIEANVHRLMAARKERGLDYPKVRMGFVQIPQNQHEALTFLDRWKGKVDYVGLSGFVNRAGSLDAKFGDQRWAPSVPACVLPFKEMNVWADGKAVLCCDDWNEEHVVGDLSKQSLREIWTGPELTRARELHRASRGGEIPICAKCNVWRGPSKGARLWS